ncbi:MAG TPA: hypothetical protein VL460_00735 [Caulobacteraceae bacterium]|jgi:hypothetical protein|nr:hypothetical protein [Caulobacteraceae bacterium]
MQTRRKTAAALGAGLFLLAPCLAEAQAQAQAPDPAAEAAASAARARKAALLPDWSGVWRAVQGPVFDAPPARKGVPAATRDHPPFTAAYEARYRANIARLRTDKEFDPLSLCLPVGLPRMMSFAGLYEFVVAPDQVWVISENAPSGPASSGAQVRRIYTDGRAHLTGDDLFPTYTGNSVGRWEGDILVVSTVGLNDANFVDHTGAQLSGEAMIVERIRATGPDTLEDRFTITDKKALTRPWAVTRTWRRAPPGVAIVDDSCRGKSVNPAALTDRAAANAARAKGQ